MSILTKEYILKNKDKFVLENVKLDQISQQSIDLSLGEYIFLDCDCPFVINNFTKFDNKDKFNGLDMEFVINSKNPNKQYYKIKLRKDKPFDLQPGMFILGYTHEWVGAKTYTNKIWQFLQKFKLDKILNFFNIYQQNICWEFKLKSTAARHGLDHNLAGWVESGYYLPLCLELHSHTTLELYFGSLIGQAVFHTTKGSAEDYSIKGNYQKTNDLQELKANWHPEDILPKSIKNKFK